MLLIREGYTICATAHDSVMLLVPLAALEARVARAQRLMEQVSLSFTKGLRVPTSVDVVRSGERLLDRGNSSYVEPRGGHLGYPKDRPEEGEPLATEWSPPPHHQWPPYPVTGGHLPRTPVATA